MSERQPSVSFEFFPPRTEALEAALLRAAKLLAPYDPSFVSVTYGAGGSTRDRTHDLVIRLQSEFNVNTAAHLTCIGANRQEIESIASQYWEQGIRRIVALRGDLPEEFDGSHPHPEGFIYALDLVKALRRLAQFEIYVAAYPEVHPEALSAEADLDNLKRKVDAGASRAITQFFLNTDKFFSFRDRAVRAGISVPILPGLLPIMNFDRVREMAGKCNVSIPDGVISIFSGVVPGTPEHREVALAFARSQIEELRKGGVEDFHFFTLNRTELLIPLCDMLKGRRKKDV